MSTITTPTIDPEFKSLIPPLTTAEFEQLEANILSDGCLDSLKTWGGVLLDGHNRFEICTKHSLPYRVEAIAVDSREDAVIWICKNQMGRRNITDSQRTYLIGKEQEARKKQRGGDRGNQYSKEARFQSGTLPQGKTAQVVAEEHGVGYGTVVRAEKYAKGIDIIGESDPELKRDILSGAKVIAKQDIGAVSKLPEPERPAAIEKIKRGERLNPPEPQKPREPEKIDRSDTTVDFSFLTQDHKLIEEDPEFSSFLNSMAADAELMAQLKEAVCIPVVSEFLVKAIKDKLTQYPDTIENADNPDRKAFVNVFNVLKKIIRK
ncbi:hypothetical protein [Sporobacter termitidis]|uniref:hypothetical protein n=1 Tax=Sporobacter termitidis TaxID=44749 RepID=UPI0013566642|nr:hypothetical protein [Sporobacter termitidis]